jgi:sterol desaturase/sphingolipid hydroxylase (fatty acid hydroxylase superfamily)
MLFFISIEKSRPSRSPPSGRIKNMFENLSLSVLASLILRLTPALLAFNVALYAEKAEVGVLNTYELAKYFPITAIVLCVILLDCAIYFQHRIFHAIPALWRLHRVHHTDQHLDASSALRFHPVEIALSMLIKSFLALIFGIPPAAIIIFEVILNASAIFNHSNFDLPKKLESITRTIIVTPTMHRIHHSEIRKDCDSNFGFCLSIWDRLFKSYSQGSKSKEKDFKLGVRYTPTKYSAGLLNLLAQPWKNFSTTESSQPIHNELDRERR